MAAFPEPAWFPWFFEYLERGRIAWYEREAAGVIISDDVLDAAQKVLRATRNRLSTATLSCPLLPCWLVPEVVALLLQRFSFARGGGPERAVSHDRMREMLLNPPKLAAYLRELPGGGVLFAGPLAEIDRDVDEGGAPEPLVEQVEATSTLAFPTEQHSLKVAHLRRLVDEVIGSVSGPMLTSRLRALRAACEATQQAWAPDCTASAADSHLLPSQPTD